MFRKIVATPFQPVGIRQTALTRGASVDGGCGLEIGALNFPTVPTAKMAYVDYATTEELKRQHRDFPDRVANMVDVDYVWPGSGSLAEIVGGTELFDFAIACHVIEHVPNVLGWFRGISEVLKVGGVFNLAIPDKRFTFDVRCPLSTLGELVEADLLGYRHPSIRQMFDNCYYGKAVDPGTLWQKEIDLDHTPPFAGEVAPHLALAQAKKIHEHGIYIDSHCWIVTPASFLDLIAGACEIGVFGMIPVSLQPTAVGEFEFYFSAEKPDPSLSPAALRERQSNQIKAIRAEIDKANRDARLFSAQG